MNESNHPCCFGKILKLIDRLQRSCDCQEGIDNTCIKPFLGAITNIECYNTRPVSFYGNDNNLISIEYTQTTQGSTTTATSSVFRVEKVEGCCCVVSLLATNPDPTATTRPYISLNQTAIINLDCVCAMKCLADTIVDL